MNKSTPILASAAILASANMASAAVTVNLTALDVNAAFNSSLGTTGAVSAPLGSTSATHSFTVSALDVADDGTANDTVVFSYDVASTGGNISSINPYAYGVDGVADPNDNEIDPGETLAFSNLNATIVFGDVTGDILSIDSAYFTRVTARFPGGDVASVTTSSGATTAFVPGASSQIVFTPNLETGFSVASEAGGNGYGIDTIGAQFVLSAVPEPSSLLLSFVGLGLLARRRR